MTVEERYRQAVERIETVHVKTFPGQPEPVFLISSAYPGVWMEHVYDAVKYARLFGEKGYEIAKNQTRLFLKNQKPNGRLPFRVLDADAVKRREGLVEYQQIQECVSIGRLCLETYRLTNDREYLREAYAALVRWDKWLCAFRLSPKAELIQLFCLFDTGHDNSARLADIPVQCPDEDGTVPVDADAVPMLAPDMNAVFYGDRCALAEMAEELKLSAEAAAWREKAECVRRAMMELLYDPGDAFFYDVDRHGKQRKFLSISVSNVFQEHVMDQHTADEVYRRHMKNPKEFWTAYPFPSMALNDPGSKKDRDGNSWGYYSQALTALRCDRWMDYYGYGADYDELLAKWVDGVTRAGMNFCQELDPVTGEMSRSSEWYSSAMLLYIYAARRLGLVKENRI